MRPSEMLFGKNSIDAFPYIENGWTVRQIFDRETGSLVSTISSKPVDPEVMSRMPEIPPKKIGKVRQIVMDLFNWGV